MIEAVLEGHFDLKDKAADEFPLLPFAVPPGIARLHVRYQVSHTLSADKAGQQEGNIVDIGIFDPRGTQFLSAHGFRGWSGTVRQEFAIGTDEATPGYLPGPIQPGIWHIVLGLYQLTAEGCDYRVVVRMEEEGKEGKEGKERRERREGGIGDQGSGIGDRETVYRRQIEQEIASTATGARWYRGDLHAHTWHSDGSAPLGDLVAAARAQGLDFVAVTEHDTISHLPHLREHSRPDLLLIPGMEITTYHGHANVWPLAWPTVAPVEFRCWRDDQMAQVRQAVGTWGALFSVNHPKDGGPLWEYGDVFAPDCMEVWGGPWFISNYQSLAVWDGQLRQGKRITAVGGSDKHQGPFTGELGWYEIGTPCTYVFAEALTVPAIMAGLRAGHVFVSEGPHGPRIELTAEDVQSGQRGTMGDELHLPTGSSLRLRCRVQDGAGNVLRLISSQETLEAVIGGDDFIYEYQVSVTGDDYWRAEVIEPPEAPLDQEPGALMAKALGNPIYVRRI